jgi:hypothetical protein
MDGIILRARGHGAGKGRCGSRTAMLTQQRFGALDTGATGQNGGEGHCVSGGGWGEPQM